jgi:glycosyltransferase involved in cell wall biosynthesis
MFLDRVGQGRSAYLGLEGKTKTRISAFNPDIIHVMYGGVLADRVCRAAKDRPVIVSFCGTDLLGEPLVGWLQKLSSGYNAWASHRAAGKATGIVVKSRNLAEALPRDIDPSKVRIIPNGVDTDRFKPMDGGAVRRQLGWPDEPAVVLFVTVRGHPRKRLGLAQETVARLVAKGHKVDLRVMRGVPHEQVPIWMNAADVLLLTSVHEGGVNVVKEAMACNLPIVSVDVGDVRERLNGVDRCAVVNDDPDALACSLQEILQQPGRSNGRNHLGDVTLPAVSQRLKEFYLEVLGQSVKECKDSVKRKVLL